MQAVGQASQRFKLDTSCYPINFDVLWSVRPAQSASDKYGNACNTAIDTQQWRGPYLKRDQISGDRIPIDSYGPGAELTILYFADSTGGAQPAVAGRNMNRTMAREVFEACGGRPLCELQNDDRNILYYYAR